MGRAHYYSRMAVAPDDPDEAYFLTRVVRRSRSTAAHDHVAARGGAGRPRAATTTTSGSTRPTPIARSSRTTRGCRSRITAARPGTASACRTRRSTTSRWTTRFPYNVLGNKQDEPSYRGPSNSRLQGGSAATGHPARRCGTRWAAARAAGPRPTRWTRTSSGPPRRARAWSAASSCASSENRRQFRNVEVWPRPVERPGRGRALPLRVGRAAAHLAARPQHDLRRQPARAPHDQRRPELGGHQPRPDAQRQDRGMGSSGGLTPDNIGVEYAGVVYGIAESPRRARADLGRHQRRAGAAHARRRQDVDERHQEHPGLPPWGSVRSIAPSRYDAGTAYLTVDGHQVNNRDPWVYRTTDYGKTWKLIVNGIPKSMLSYAKVIHEDPVRRGLLYLGTENAHLRLVRRRRARGSRCRTTCRTRRCSGIVVQEHFNDLVISTYGRGFWILDDITPLRALTPEVLAPTRTSSRRGRPTASAASRRRRRRTTIRRWARTRRTARRSTTT